MKRILCSVLALALATAVHAAQGPAPATSAAMQAAPATTVQPTGSNPDIAFYQQALAGGAREILLSDQAVSRASSAEVRSLASTLVSDHTAMDRQLADAGKLPEPQPTAADRRQAASLQRMSGVLFDRSYLAAMERDHQAAIALFNETMLHASDSSTRNLATSGLDALNRHLAAIQLQQHRVAGD